MQKAEKKPKIGKERITDGVKADIQKLHIGKLKTKKGKNGGAESKQCKISYELPLPLGKSEFIFKVPKSKVVFDITKTYDSGDKKSGEYKKYTVDIQLEGSDELLQFGKFLSAFDEKNVAYITKSSAEWWGEECDEKTVRRMSYGTIVKKTPASKGEYPDRFRFKLPFKKGRPDFKLFDENNDPIVWITETDDLDNPELDWSWTKGGIYVESLLQCEAIWVVGTKVYCTFKALQVRVSKSVPLPDNAFDDDDDEVEEAVVGVKKLTVKTEDQSDSDAGDAPVTVDDDDDDDDDEDDDDEKDDNNVEDDAVTE